MCAPRADAWWTLSMARCKFFSGSEVVDICISPTLNFCGGKTVAS